MNMPRESKSGQTSVQSFDTVLPAAASDIYYRDEIGNISTSHIRIKKEVELNLRPRFPLIYYRDEIGNISTSHIRIKKERS